MNFIRYNFTHCELSFKFFINHIIFFHPQKKLYFRTMLLIWFVFLGSAHAFKNIPEIKPIIGNTSKPLEITVDNSKGYIIYYNNSFVSILSCMFFFKGNLLFLWKLIILQNFNCISCSPTKIVTWWYISRIFQVARHWQSQKFLEINGGN